MMTCAGLEYSSSLSYLLTLDGCELSTKRPGHLPAEKGGPPLRGWVGLRAVPGAVVKKEASAFIWKRIPIPQSFSP